MERDRSAAPAREALGQGAPGMGGGEKRMVSSTYGVRRRIPRTRGRIRSAGPGILQPGSDIVADAGLPNEASGRNFFTPARDRPNFLPPTSVMGLLLEGMDVRFPTRPGDAAPGSWSPPGTRPERTEAAVLKHHTAAWASRSSHRRASGVRGPIFHGIWRIR
jgi:hypothetical protein